MFESILIEMRMLHWLGEERARKSHSSKSLKKNWEYYIQFLQVS